jgi:hypothetical protein
MAGCFDVYETKNYHHGNATGVFTMSGPTENYLSAHIEQKIRKLF